MLHHIATSYGMWCRKSPAGTPWQLFTAEIGSQNPEMSLLEDDEDGSNHFISFCHVFHGLDVKHQRHICKVQNSVIEKVLLLDLPGPVVFNRSRSSEHFLATSFASTNGSTHFYESTTLECPSLHPMIPFTLIELSPKPKNLGGQPGITLTFPPRAVSIFVMFYSHISRDPSINETFCFINLQQKYRKTPIKHFKCTVIILPNIFPTRDAHTKTNDDDTYDNYIQLWQRWWRRWWWWWWWCYHPFQHAILSHPFTSFYRRTPWPRPQCLLPRRHLWQTLKPNDPPA